MRLLLTLLLAFSIAPSLTRAETFQVVTNRDLFVQLVQGRKLTRLGISLNVTEGGQIVGRAFGQPVTGQWRWEQGYFCRSLYHGSKDLGPNCQEVRVRGSTLRFTSDRGTGIYADLRLK